MSELRAKVANELGSALADWVDNKTSTDSNRPAIIAAINDFAYDEADAVLRVLAEHGDTQQVREQIKAAVSGKCNASDGIHYCHDTNAEHRTDAVMTIVAPIVAARDAAVERAEFAESELSLAGQACDGYRAERDEAEELTIRAEADVEAAIERANKAEAGLEAARQQLEQVRALADDWKRQSTDHYEVYGAPLLVNLGAHASRIIQALDAPARPAGHDESGSGS